MSRSAKRTALVLALALALAATGVACKGPAARHTFAATTSSSSSTTSATSSTSTTALAVTPAPNGCDAAALRRADPLPNLTTYTVTATYRADTNIVFGDMEALFTPDKDTDRVYMRLWGNGPTPASHGGKIDLSGASVDDQQLPLNLASPTTAYVDRALSAHKQIKLRVHFQETLPTNSDDRLARVGNTVRLGSWLPLLPWEPGVGWALDPPTTSNAEASISVASDFNVHLDVPAGLTVLATGTQVDAADWQARAVPDWAASIGNFNVVDGSFGATKVTVGVDQSIHESPNAYLARVLDALADLSRRYGPYAYPTFTLALTPGLVGGIEYPGHVMQGPNTNARTTPHEVAHQWFYSLVNNDQGRDPWLDEGLASWAEAQTNHTYASFLAKPIPADGRDQLGQPMTFWDPIHNDYYGSVYVQTVQALGALGVSSAAVDCALARYVAANAYRVATPQSLIDALKTVAPNAAAVFARYGAQRIS